MQFVLPLLRFVAGGLGSTVALLIARKRMARQICQDVATATVAMEISRALAKTPMPQMERN